MRSSLANIPTTPFLNISALGLVHDFMPGRRHFWAGEGCSVEKNGPVVQALRELAVRHDVDILIPHSDLIRPQDVAEFLTFANTHGMERFVLGSLAHLESDLLPIIQIPCDDGLFVHGFDYAAKNVSSYKNAIDLHLPFEEKEDCLYWAGGFSGGGRRQRLVERLAGVDGTNVAMVHRWTHEDPAFMAGCLHLVRPIQPLRHWGHYQKLLSMDGHGVGGNATLNALLDVVFVFHGRHEPLWMRFARENIHYLRIRDDFSNLDAVLASLKDTGFCQFLRHNLNEHMKCFMRQDNVMFVVEQEIADSMGISLGAPAAAAIAPAAGC